MTRVPPGARVFLSTLREDHLQGLAYKAYGQVEKRTASDQHIELAVFRQITNALRDVASQDRPNPADWADALHRNQQLWSTLAVDLVQPGNMLPVELKRSLLVISEFVRKHSLDVLAGGTGLDDLIEVNESIIAGLSRGQEAL